eukprot:TRINITY_DN4796_c0_g1_i2.p1 TRINITY_DN4796_c0_g1~~TRINITY_DN4796_c0_g1_i2.p1  ORF type:complete len:135 (+),score=23.62 TRINITY_DN4796_c0_g1_i2:65-469(+)
MCIRDRYRIQREKFEQEREVERLRRVKSVLQDEIELNLTRMKESRKRYEDLAQYLTTKEDTRRRLESENRDNQRMCGGGGCTIFQNSKQDNLDFSKGNFFFMFLFISLQRSNYHLEFLQYIHVREANLEKEVIV